jgi:hypothetical protein
MKDNNNKIELENPSSNKNEKGNTFNIIKEGWDKLSLEYNNIVTNLNSFNDSLDEEHKKSFKLIITSLEKFKDDFKNLIFNISVSIGNISSNSPNQNINDININLSVKDSYDNIYNEFLELESLTKHMISNQNKVQKNRSIHFQNIEKKLQGFLEEINDFDFKKINKNYNKIYGNLNQINNNNNDNDNEKVNILIQRNNIVEKYNPLDYNLNIFENNKNEEEVEIDDELDDDNMIEKEDLIKKNQIKREKDNHKSNSENNVFLSTEEKEVKILNEIINMNGLNQEEAVKYIQLLINNEKKK